MRFFKKNSYMMRTESRINKEKVINKYYNFWETLCFSFCIFKKKKRNFFNMISQIINNKISIEYLLKLSNRFENLKLVSLNDEEIKSFDTMSPMSLEEQMKEFGLKYEN